MFSSKLLIGTLLLLSTLPTPSLGIFDLTMPLSCKKGYENWCADIVIYEIDAITKPDFVAEKTICSTPNLKNGTIIADFGTIDPGRDWSNEYEILPVISHNCSSDGKMHCFKPQKHVDIDVFTHIALKLKVDFDGDGDMINPCDRLD